jgi:hypothetical protein
MGHRQEQHEADSKAEYLENAKKILHFCLDHGSCEDEALKHSLSGLAFEDFVFFYEYANGDTDLLGRMIVRRQEKVRRNINSIPVAK